MVEISVIVPVYNSEKYLHKCIDSILAQTFTDFELLLIDDGSKDNSSAICDEYAKKDARLKVFHKENGGVTSARRIGVMNAVGRFVTFVDSDDELYINALSILFNNVIDNDDIDIVASDLKFEGIISGDQYVRNILCGRMYNRLWGNLYKRSLLTDWVMDINRKINIGEDAIMNIRIGLSMINNHIKCISERIYYYRDNPESVMHTRKISLEYDELYINLLTKTLGDRIDNYRAEYFYSNLNTLENLIVCRIVVNYNRPWIKDIKQWYKNRPLTFRHWIVLNIPYNLLCKYILAIEKRINILFNYAKNFSNRSCL